MENFTLKRENWRNKKKLLDKKKERQVKGIVGLIVDVINTIKESFKNRKEVDAQDLNVLKKLKKKEKNI